MFPPVTQALLVINIGFFLLQSAGAGLPWQTFALWPLGPMFQPWQIASYAFLHADLTHVLFNTLGIVMFGADLERVWGSRRFSVYYAASVLGAALVQLAVSSIGGGLYPTIGASGGVFGLLLAFAVVFPDRIVMPLFPPIPMPAWLFATLYGGVELTLGVTGYAPGIAHFAHLGGILGGALVLLWWRNGRNPFRTHIR